jgi:hypothetical protein
MPYKQITKKQITTNLSNCDEKIKSLIGDIVNFVNTNGCGFYNFDMLNKIQDQNLITTMGINELRTEVKTTTVISGILENIVDQEERRRRWTNESAILNMKEDNKNEKDKEEKIYQQRE